MNPVIFHVRRSRIICSPMLDIVPMMADVAAKFTASPKARLKMVGAEIAAEKAALWQSLEDHGIREAVPVTLYELDGTETRGADITETALLNADRKLIAWDGRHRLEWAAKAKGVSHKVPVRFVTEDEGRSLQELTVIGRRHWNKGQRAWLGVLQHPEVCQVKREDSLKQNNRSDSVGTMNATTLAARLGVSADLVGQAAELYALFYAPGSKPGSPAAIAAAAARGKYEHLIWGGAGLGAIKAGVCGGDATGGKQKAPTGFHHLDAPLASLTRLSKHWMEWDAEERGKAQSLIAARIRGNSETPGWPAEFCLAIGEALAAAGV